MGIRASSTTTVRFEDVRLGSEHVLGGVGKGFKNAMRILNSGRTGLGGGCVGGMRRLIGLAARQAKERKQFGRPISDFGMVKQKVGEMVADAYAAESVVRMVSGLIDQGYQDYAVEAAISKVYATEALWRTSDEALQIAGGNGYMREFPYERAMRDARINRIFEGTNDILRLFIALTAMNQVAAQLKDVAQSVKGVLADPIKGFGVLSDYALKQASVLTGLVGERRGWTKLHPALRDPQEQFEEHARELAWAADRVLRRHGKAIIDKQFALRRIADILVDQFVLACVLSRVQAALDSKGEAKSAHELSLLKVVARRVRGRVRGNFRRMDVNDDEIVKELADDAFEREAYGWDAI
jgi:alkylation response protein AidB-like acyl-CoA dehydrogenase